MNQERQVESIKENLEFIFFLGKMKNETNDEDVKKQFKNFQDDALKIHREKMKKLNSPRVTNETCIIV